MGKERPISDEREVRSFGPFGSWENDDEPKDKPVHKGEITANPEDDIIAQIDAKREIELSEQGANREPSNTQDAMMVDELMEDGLREAQQLAAANRHGELQAARALAEGTQIGTPRKDPETTAAGDKYDGADMRGKRNENNERISIEAAARKERKDKEHERTGI